MMTLVQIRERNRKENAAAQRLQAAGYRLEGWDPRTGQRIAARTPSCCPGRAALWARPHTSTTASSFTPVAMLRPANAFNCSKPWTTS